MKNVKKFFDGSSWDSCEKLSFLDPVLSTISSQDSDLIKRGNKMIMSILDRKSLDLTDSTTSSLANHDTILIFLV